MRSNLRLLDSINRPKQIIDKALEMGLTGVAITDHECISSHIEVVKYAKTLDPEFKVALGNEIYLTDTRENGQKYFHFILIAKDAKGHRAIRELSSRAWYNSYTDRGMERVPTLKSELYAVLNEYKGHVIGTTACLGGEFAFLVEQLNEAKKKKDLDSFNDTKEKIVKFCYNMKEIFGDDFYIELAPATSKEQIAFNEMAINISIPLDIKLTIGTDAHYLTKDDRFVHKSYLNSKNGEREVDDFYEFSYLMSPQEVKDLFLQGGIQEPMIDEIMKSSNELANKITRYDLSKESQIPVEEVRDFPVITDAFVNYPAINKMLSSNSRQDRYWINSCLSELKRICKIEHVYLDRLNTEADVVDFISDRLGQSLTAYFNTLQSYINLFWEEGSIVGPGRGSAVGFLSNYLLGITQLDPIEWNLPYWRFLNKERVELPKLKYWASKSW